MSDHPFILPETPPLMSAITARDLARSYKGFADHIRAMGDISGAAHAERQSSWFMAYAIALSQIPPGSVSP